MPLVRVMYGQGGKFGPDLTGSGRSNLDYILENVVDPSAVVSADYRMTILRLKDGRILSGMESKRGKNSLALRMLVRRRCWRRRRSNPGKSCRIRSCLPGLLDGLSRKSDATSWPT